MSLRSIRKSSLDFVELRDLVSYWGSIVNTPLGVLLVAWLEDPYDVADTKTSELCLISVLVMPLARGRPS